MGINSAHALFAQNIGFAIGMNTAKNVFDDLVTRGKVDHPFIGIIAEDMKPQLTIATMNAQRRVIITKVEEGTPSNTAGLKENDIILQVNGKAISSLAELTRILWRMGAGDTIRITGLRNGDILDLTVILTPRPNSEPLAEL